MSEAERLGQIEAKLDFLISSIQAKPDKRKYLSAKEVADLTGLNSRTILNRSGLQRNDPRYIPSIQFGGSRRRFYERKTVERLFQIAT
jgi:hypothetical protein